MKKVRGRPVLAATADLAEGNSNTSNSHCLSMALLVTLPLESTVTPLLPKSPPPVDDGENNSESPMFNPFSFEDYAWRVYHERLLLKDPLVRYRL